MKKGTLTVLTMIGVIATAFFAFKSFVSERQVKTLARNNNDLRNENNNVTRQNDSLRQQNSIVVQENQELKTHIAKLTNPSEPPTQTV